MNTAELKADLYNLIEKTEDISILNALKVLLTKKVKYEKLSWDDFPEALKSEIDEGLEQIENAELKTHKEVMQKYEKWL